MVLVRQRPQSRPRLRVGAKFFITVGVLVPAVLATAAVGASGLERMHTNTDTLYTHSLAVSQHSAAVTVAMLGIQESTLYQVAVDDPQLDAELTAELDQVLIPRAQQALVVLHSDLAGNESRRQHFDRIEAGLRQYLALRGSGAYAAARARGATQAARTAFAKRVDGILEPVAQAAEQLRSEEAQESAQVKRDADKTYTSTWLLLAASVVVVLLLGLTVVLALIRNVVPRIRTYSQFATDIAAGRPATVLTPSGHDELTDLGIALNDMVRHRDEATRAEQDQRAVAVQAEQSQAEFVDTLQVTRSEDEAQELLQHHLQRSLPGSAVTVLRRNNSANRLQAATGLPAGSELAAKLLGAEPRSCVAVRLGRSHREGAGLQPLLTCSLCEDGERPSTCEPLLVGGEVIGSVLVTRTEAVSDSDDGRIKTTVGQAAPVLANLRSLALAEFRASNDSLTGLPNKRATEDTLKRMVAQAGRSVAPLTAIMLDLDHFKSINDRYGHPKGDEVLAAVGLAIQSGLRASDFAGRFGGEEFLILLPETSVQGAWQVAESIRLSIAAVNIPGVDRAVTASLGIAGLLEHAGDATGLLREADRAQYAAKAAGRNRTVVAAVASDAETGERPDGTSPQHAALPVLPVPSKRAAAGTTAGTAAS